MASLYSNMVAIAPSNNNVTYLVGCNGEVYIWLVSVFLDYHKLVKISRFAFKHCYVFLGLLYTLTKS